MNALPFYRRLWLLMVVLAAALMPAPAWAAENDFALSAVFAYGPYFRQDQWIPVRIMLSNRSASAVVGEVVCPIKGEAGQVNFHLPITVPASASINVIANVYIPPPQQVDPNQRRKNAGKMPPVFIAEWRTSGGEMISRCEVLGQPVGEEEPTADPATPLPVDQPLVLAFTDDLSAPSNLLVPEDASDASLFAGMLQSPPGNKVFAVAMGTFEAPRERAGYDTAAVVLLNNLDVRELDQAQRQSLIDYMTTGGVVLLSDVRGAAIAADTWLQPYLPAAYVGSRYVSSVTLKGSLLNFSGPMDIAEWVAIDPASNAVAGAATIISADNGYVHAAYRRVGLGRLVVTSFPVNAINLKTPAVRDVWRELLTNSRPSVTWEQSELSAWQHDLLQSMIGLRVPPWAAAAGVVGAYVLVVLAIQLFVRQTRRPTGFAVVIGVSVVLAGGLMVLTLVKDRSVDLSTASINVLDIDHGGVRHETTAMIGPNSDSVSLAAARGASVRQTATEESRPVDLTVSPAGARNAQIAPRAIQRVWQATSALPAGQVLRASGQFNERGLQLKIDNRIGQLIAPVLICQNNQFVLSDLPTGQTTAFADESNLNAARMQLEAEQVRGQILAASFKPAGASFTVMNMQAASIDPQLTLAGWLEEPLPPLLQISGQSPAAGRQNTLVRATVEMLPSPAGTRVHVPGAFITPQAGDMGTLPFNSANRQWLEQFMPQEFQVGFAVPPAIGKLKPDRITVSLAINAPQQTVTVRRGQCADGLPRSNPMGDIVAQWDKPISRQTVTFDVQPGDIDPNGWLWLYVHVEGPMLNSRWQISDFTASYDGVIDGPPYTPVYRQPEPMQVSTPQPAQPTKPQTTKSSAPKKPTTRPATNARTNPTTKSTAIPNVDTPRNNNG